MKVNLGVTLTDAQRVIFNEALGEPKMASRKQVVAFLQGCLDAIILTEESPRVIKKQKKVSKVVQIKVLMYTPLMETQHLKERVRSISLDGIGLNLDSNYIRMRDRG